MKAKLFFTVTTTIYADNFEKAATIADNVAKQNTGCKLQPNYEWKVEQVEEIEDDRPSCFGDAEKMLVGLEKSSDDCDSCKVMDECATAVHYGETTP